MQPAAHSSDSGQKRPRVVSQSIAHAGGLSSPVQCGRSSRPRRGRIGRESPPLEVIGKRPQHDIVSASPKWVNCSAVRDLNALRIRRLSKVFYRWKQPGVLHRQKCGEGLIAVPRCCLYVLGGIDETPMFFRCVFAPGRGAEANGIPSDLHRPRYVTIQHCRVVVIEAGIIPAQYRCVIRRAHAPSDDVFDDVGVQFATSRSWCMPGFRSGAGRNCLHLNTAISGMATEAAGVNSRRHASYGRMFPPFVIQGFLRSKTNLSAGWHRKSRRTGCLTCSTSPSLQLRSRLLPSRGRPA